VLAAKKKIAVREVAQKSTVSEYWAKTRAFYDAYQKYLLYGGVAVVVIAVFGYIYISNKQKNNEEANRLLRVVQPLVQQGQYKMAIEGDKARKISGLLDIVNQYGGTPTGQLAGVLLGNCYLYSDQFDKALAAFDDASPSSDLLAAAAYAGMAASYEGKKDYASAAKYYQKSASAYDNEFLTAARYFNAGRMYCMSNDKEKAKEMLTKVRDSNTPRYETDIMRLNAQYGLNMD
jgi:tetratricopeptide (TPR) repeat protein